MSATRQVSVLKHPHIAKSANLLTEMFNWCRVCHNDWPWASAKCLQEDQDKRDIESDKRGTLSDPEVVYQVECVSYDG